MCGRYHIAQQQVARLFALRYICFVIVIAAAMTMKRTSTTRIDNVQIAPRFFPSRSTTTTTKIEKEEVEWRFYIPAVAQQFLRPFLEAER